METLVVVSQHRSHSYAQSRSQNSNRFSSAPTRGLKGITCRTFEAGGTGPGILPSPIPQPPKPSSPITITPKQSPKLKDEISCSELWAGPAYSNSPPPSSVPIPKFSLRQKRSISLDFPSTPAPGRAVPRPVAQSAPSSPTRALSSPSPSPSSGFFLSTAFATQNLRRILNLDIADDE